MQNSMYSTVPDPSCVEPLQSRYRAVTEPLQGSLRERLLLLPQTSAHCCTGTAYEAAALSFLSGHCAPRTWSACEKAVGLTLHRTLSKHLKRR